MMMIKLPMDLRFVLMMKMRVIEEGNLLVNGTFPFLYSYSFCEWTKTFVYHRHLKEKLQEGTQLGDTFKERDFSDDITHQGH